MGRTRGHQWGQPAAAYGENKLAIDTRDAPAKHHMVWHEEMAPLWDEIAAMDPVLADNARRLAEFHRGEAARLSELDPDLPDDAEW